ncbi:hypothetical protein RRG08_013117 [Elysia crispata]|uniref:Uncharacterized protein n=1 Tax=Elysia crispata TaxID=231223 RepID=A0AAE1A1D0_9GAST|nr:hypothetical protein RRG08_013117 [Elysia crispata]
MMDPKVFGIGQNLTVCAKASTAKGLMTAKQSLSEREMDISSGVDLLFWKEVHLLDTMIVLVRMYQNMLQDVID